MIIPNGIKQKYLSWFERDLNESQFDDSILYHRITYNRESLKDKRE
jgi:phage anti-repressor protein